MSSQSSLITSTTSSQYSVIPSAEIAGGSPPAAKAGRQGNYYFFKCCTHPMQLMTGSSAGLSTALGVQQWWWTPIWEGANYYIFSASILNTGISIAATYYIGKLNNKRIRVIENQTDGTTAAINGGKRADYGATSHVVAIKEGDGCNEKILLLWKANLAELQSFFDEFAIALETWRDNPTSGIAKMSELEKKVTLAEVELKKEISELNAFSEAYKAHKTALADRMKRVRETFARGDSKLEADRKNIETQIKRLEELTTKQAAQNKELEQKMQQASEKAKALATARQLTAGAATGMKSGVSSGVPLPKSIAPAQTAASSTTNSANSDP